MSKQPEALRLAEVFELATDTESVYRKAAATESVCRKAAAELRRLHAVIAELLEALKDMHSGLKYIRETHGDLYGVGWDRSQEKAEAAIAKAEEVQP